eukprot:COSAG02_NODE_4509_length_5280_cov_2.005790_2_plen_56_part_00
MTTCCLTNVDLRYILLPKVRLLDNAQKLSKRGRRGGLEALSASNAGAKAIHYSWR